jgi:hypothetical protein
MDALWALNILNIKKGLAKTLTPLILTGVPKGIPFDDTQDKFTPVAPPRAGYPWPDERTHRFCTY